MKRAALCFLLVFVFATGLVIKQRSGSKERISGKYFKSVSPSGDTLLLRIRANASVPYRAVYGSISTSNRVLEVHGELGADVVSGTASHRLANGRETNVVFKAEVNAAQLTMEVIQEESPDLIDSVMVAKEKHTSGFRRFRFGRYGASLKSTAYVPLIETEFLSVSMLNEELEQRAQTKTLEFQSGFWNLLKDSFRMPGMSYDWQFETDFELQFVSANFASVKILNYRFTGGAHGNTHFEGRNYFSSRAGELIEFQLIDLFGETTEGIDRCSLECLASLRNQGAQFVSNGMTSELSAEDLSACTVNSRGLVFHFSHYQVGSYAQGTFQAFVPAKVIIKHLVRTRVGLALSELWKLQ